MAKTHYKIIGTDARNQGQTEFEYQNQTACGYVRDSVTDNPDQVDCELCWRSKHMEHTKAINSSFSDSQGCY